MHWTSLGNSITWKNESLPTTVSPNHCRAASPIASHAEYTNRLLSAFRAQESRCNLRKQIDLGDPLTREECQTRDGSEKLPIDRDRS